MSNRRSTVAALGFAALGLAGLALSGCATASSPWVVHEQTADLKALSSQPDRICPVVVQNGTEQILDARVEGVSGEPLSLGLISAGQSVTLGVACADRRVEATAVALDPGALDATRRLRASALLDVVRETHLRFTTANDVRW